ncbi:hypothetical protein D9619_011002 [Psilocybe cf. subviscida]|uniref:Nephrocystin 3-like N-terminal domain-containing protein n=1 Tax=Psilocybe cf. subviscida TaxID=2480587 RepID=A0A8H5F019_9AGAR|nr:hypothetical protein D9619_011002 [Psilocybe cf. subviscida]
MANPSRTFFGGANINSINGGTFQVVCESVPTGSFIGEAYFSSFSTACADAARKLLSRHIAPNALPDSAAMYDAPKCYPETRKAINSKLQRWIWRQANLDTKLMWLHGGAGAGKSAILRTIALGDETRGYNIGTPRVLGSFFFSRTDPTRNTAQVLVPTLAFQLCKAHPVAKDIVLNNIADNYELIFTTSMRNQVHSLLVEPLSHLELRYNWLSNVDQDQGEPGRVFVIDGLDECADSKKQVEIIEAIAILVRDLPVRVLLASRPDVPIPSTIRNSAVLRGVLLEISLSDDPDSEADIRFFVEQTLREVREKYHSQSFNPVSDSWPERRHIDELVKKSSSHFAYASTAMNYIASGDERPDVALHVILGLKTPRTGMPFQEIDTLYRYILDKAKFRNELLKILSHCVFTGFSRSVESIQLVLGYTREDILHFLSDVSALVSVVPHPHEGAVVQLKHASLGDFLRNQSRAKEFYIGPSRQFHRDHLKRYFILLDIAQIFPGDNEVERLAIYSATDKDNFDPLVRHIATGIAASPLSDEVTSLIRQHPPRVLYKFLEHSVEEFRWRYYSDALASYIRGIHDYDVEGSIIFRECLEDFLGVQESIEEFHSGYAAVCDRNNFRGIIAPLLLVGIGFQTLVDIAWAGFERKIQYLTLGAFMPGFKSPLPKCRHYYPVRILRQIRQGMPDADEGLAWATTRLLQVIVNRETVIYGNTDEEDGLLLYGAILKALAFILPKLAYHREVASYTSQRLPPPPLVSPDKNGHEAKLPKRAVEGARQAMKDYSMRGGDSDAIMADASNWDLDSDESIYGSDTDYYSVLVWHSDSDDGSEREEGVAGDENMDDCDLDHANDDDV